jgi:DUF971 family protein
MASPPTNIRAHQGEQLLELTWPEGRVSRLPYHFLRSECPCAVCVDEWTGKRVLDPASISRDIKLDGMEAVGSYAVRFSWSDGHSSGLFTWETLLRLSDEHPFG